MKYSYLLAFLFFAIFSSCEEEEEPKVISEVSKAYLEEVLEIMHNNSIHRHEIDWEVFYHKVYERAQGAQNIKETLPAIQLALYLLEDDHSSYTSAEGTRMWANKEGCGSVFKTTVPPDDEIGYVKVPRFGKGGPEAVAFAQSIQNTIKAADNEKIRGWIVDLRGNGGGNMWPMLAGVGPLLGEGVVGYFYDPDGNYYPWTYEKGASMNNGHEITKVPSPYTLLQENPKIAILTDESIASSGEAIAISFKANPNTRSFGYPTCGLSTANAPFAISDGAWLSLTIGAMADRTKKVYGKAVLPDESLPEVTAVEKAIEWLKE